MNNGKKWTKEEELQIIELYNKGYFKYEIAKELNVTLNKLKYFLKKIELPARKQIKDNSQEIENLYKQGKTSAEIGEIFNVCQSSICNVLRENNIKTRTNSEYKRKSPIRDTFFNQIDTKEKSNILGFIYADGYHDEDKSSISITLHRKDIDFLIKMSNAIQPLKENPIKTFQSKSKTKNNGPSAQLVFYSRKISLDLYKIGCYQNKSFTVDFPNIDKKYYPQFASGYFDGDGCLGYTVHPQSNKLAYYITICVSKNFGTKLKQIIKKELKINVSLEKHSSIYRLRIGGNNQTEKFMDWLYQNSPIKLNRKYKKYLEMKQYFRRYNEQKYGKKDVLPLP